MFFLDAVGLQGLDRCSHRGLVIGYPLATA
jgi:hypothetical protein